MKIRLSTLLFIVFLSVCTGAALQIYVNGGMSPESAQLDKNIEISKRLIDELVVESNNRDIQRIKLDLEAEVDKLYEPTYKQISVLADYKYSVTGTYVNIYNILTLRASDKANEILFIQVDFNGRLKAMLDAMNLRATSYATQTMVTINEKIGTVKNIAIAGGHIIPLNAGESSKYFKDVKPAWNALVSAGREVVFKFSQKLAASTAGKVVARNAFFKWAGGKLVSVGAFVGGVVVCSPGGPAAYACGIAAGAATWVATDYIIIKIDEYWNRKDYEAEIRAMIDRHKEETKNKVTEIYTETYRALGRDFRRHIQAF